MAHDVLISYSSHDKLQAEAICNRLESRGIRCWIAPRDVGLGEYAESIVEAIEEAKVMVLVFSANADRSDQVKRELERAVSKGTTIVPVRIEEAEMSKSVEFYVSSVHWLDAITPPLEEHIDGLANQLQSLLAEMEEDAAAPEVGAAVAPTPSVPTSATAEPAPASAPSPPPVAAPGSGGSTSGLKKGLGIVAGLAALAVIALFALNRGADGPEAQPSQRETLEGAEATSGDAAYLEMTFINRTPDAAAVVWIDDQGQETHYETLSAGQSWTAETYAGHEWELWPVDAERRFPLVRCFAPQDDPCVAIGAAKVSYVGLVDGDGEPAGAFAQSEGLLWAEQAVDGTVRYNFQETGRDEWSVYITDASRGADIQLDLFTGRVKYSDANNPQFDLYDIKEASE